eukprot:TRINITY_DN8325_c0_g1_i2.p1 TRINITY_DN8325_c0_g1~~TRINITY_DN8325_c0_g1_i2.p1  ORF type:complete len:220 (+),score=57.36 TRINITY_DN8325_c0_g1_i2:342-1001(+)
MEEREVVNFSPHISSPKIPRKSINQNKLLTQKEDKKQEDSSSTFSRPLTSARKLSDRKAKLPHYKPQKAESSDFINSRDGTSSPILSRKERDKGRSRTPREKKEEISNPTQFASRKLSHTNQSFNKEEEKQSLEGSDANSMKMYIKMEESTNRAKNLEREGKESISTFFSPRIPENSQINEEKEYSVDITLNLPKKKKNFNFNHKSCQMIKNLAAFWTL